MVETATSVFWVTTVISMFLGWVLSHAIGEHGFFPKQGLITDLTSAAVLWGLSYIVEFVANVIKLECGTYGELTDFDQSGCETYAGEVHTVSDVLNNTLGINPVLFAAGLFGLFAIVMLVVRNKK
ncbi:hypothetical protein EK599_15090 [Vibrio sp. T187]|uniref:hypothetical protein n=1 Tax=Vibrio TaxID=662 RepID=UPI0010C95512|nr:MULTISPECIES: hypothetical protein [Vibrio]MBW3697025.1 hypothetical protein [Vibrio sp. T187]